MSVVVKVQPPKSITARVDPATGILKPIKAVIAPTDNVTVTFGTTPDINVSLEDQDVGGPSQQVNLPGMASIPRSLDDLDDVTILNNVDKQVLVYSANTQQYRNLSIHLDGGAENQILVKKSGTDYDYQWEDMVINLPESTYTKLIDQANSTVMYLGEAAPNTAESSASWRLQKILFDATGNVEEVRYTFSGLFTGVWDSRATYTYI